MVCSSLLLCDVSKKENERKRKEFSIEKMTESDTIRRRNRIFLPYMSRSTYLFTSVHMVGEIIME